MLKNLLECNNLTDFIIIQDQVDVGGEDLFVTFLKKHSESETIKEVILVCWENPPEFYLKKIEESEKIKTFNFFENYRSWENDSTQSNLRSLISDPTTLTNSAFFIDSISDLIMRHGFFSTYKNLSELKLMGTNVICLAHGDVCSCQHLEKLKFLSSACIKLEKIENDQQSTEKNQHSNKKSAYIIYKKPGGKIINQTEVFSVNSDFVVFSKIKRPEPSKGAESTKIEINNLTTFKLGLQMSASEKKAKDELILPYLRAKPTTSTGEIIYNQEAGDDLEDDPDDDLDF